MASVLDEVFQQIESQQQNEGSVQVRLVGVQGVPSEQPYPLVSYVEGTLLFVKAEKLPRPPVFQPSLMSPGITQPGAISMQFNNNTFPHPTSSNPDLLQNFDAAHAANVQLIVTQTPPNLLIAFPTGARINVPLTFQAETNVMMGQAEHYFYVLTFGEVEGPI
jgi:hypothetical protein